MSIKDIHAEYGPKEGIKTLQGWIKMWELDVTPWNKGEAALGLQKLVSENRIPEKGNFLVPGCGQGYDCFLLYNNKRNIVGVDLYEGVIKQNIEKKQKLYFDKLSFYACDFFQNDVLVDNSFDFIFDYTFLCALDPSYRSSWALQLSRLLKSGGMLVTLMYPLSDHEGGPPFALSIEKYHELLDSEFIMNSIEDCKSFPAREGKEKLAIWTRK
jgi:ubiquinone/menaquinone biosynthesis C-methylase UbiE